MAISRTTIAGGLTVAGAAGWTQAMSSTSYLATAAQRDLAAIVSVALLFVAAIIWLRIGWDIWKALPSFQHVIAFFRSWRFQWPLVRKSPPLTETYVGQMLLIHGDLSSSHSCELTIRAFNFAPRAISISAISGHADFWYEATPGNMPSMGALPTPTLMLTIPEKSFPSGAEFIIHLKQPLPPNMVQQALTTLSNGMSIQLDLRGLNIDMNGLTNGPKRLPLWDGISASTKPSTVGTGRATMVALQATARVMAKVG